MSSFTLYLLITVGAEGSRGRTLGVSAPSLMNEQPDVAVLEDSESYITFLVQRMSGGRGRPSSSFALTGAMFNEAPSEAAFRGMAVMELAAELKFQTPRKALVLGLGAGTVPAKFAAKGIDTHVIELDQDVIDLWQKHFNPHYGVSEDAESASLPNENIIRANAFEMLDFREPPNNEAYNIIVADLFTGRNSLELASPARYLNWKRGGWLEEGGIVVVNTVSLGVPRGQLDTAPARTAMALRMAFKFVSCLAEVDPQIAWKEAIERQLEDSVPVPDHLINIVCFATDSSEHVMHDDDEGPTRFRFDTLRYSAAPEGTADWMKMQCHDWTVLQYHINKAGEDARRIAVEESQIVEHAINLTERLLPGHPFWSSKAEWKREESSGYGYPFIALQLAAAAVSFVITIGILRLVRNGKSQIKTPKAD